jgi:hypothetical protein
MATELQLSLNHSGDLKLMTQSVLIVLVVSWKSRVFYLSMGLAPCRGYPPIYTLRSSLHSSAIEFSSPTDTRWKEGLRESVNLVGEAGSRNLNNLA